ncbi:guanylate-binding protein 5 isoform X1 [Balamuthia mandrillaris]
MWSSLLLLSLLLLGSGAIGDAASSSGQVADNSSGKAVQLVRPEPYHRGLEVVEEGLAVLESMTEPVAIVGVVGPFKTGKSFLLNQLMGRSEGFTIGPTVDPATTGLWLWSEPSKRPLTESGHSYSVAFLDTEGFFSSQGNEDYDAKVFSLAALLSSHLLFNTLRTADAASLDYLELLSQRASLFAFKSSERTSSVDEQQPENDQDNLADVPALPFLTWVVQDFFSELPDQTSSTDWLLRLLKDRKRDNTRYSPERKLQSLYQKDALTCHTLSYPAQTRQELLRLDLTRPDQLSQDYLKELAELNMTIMSKLLPKTGPDGKFLDGKGLATLLRLLTRAINAPDKFPQMPSTWDGFLQLQLQTALDSALNHYKTSQQAFLNSSRNSALEPVGIARLLNFHKKAMDEAIDFYHTFFSGFHLSGGTRYSRLFQQEQAKGEGQLRTRLEEVQALTEAENRENIYRQFAEETANLRTVYTDKVKQLQMPMPMKLWLQAVTELHQAALTDFKTILQGHQDSEFYGLAIEQAERDIAGLLNHHTIRNEEAIMESLKQALASAEEAYSSFLAKPLGSPNACLNETALRITNAVALNAFWTTFENQTQRLRQEPLYGGVYSQAQEAVTNLQQSFSNNNSKCLHTLFSEATAVVVDCATKESNELIAMLPVEEGTIHSRMNALALSIVERYHALPELSDFHGDRIYRHHEALLKENVEQLRGKLCQLNVQKMKKVVAPQLEDIKSVLAEECSSYIFTWSFTRRARALANERLEKIIQWPSLREAVVEDFISHSLVDLYNQVDVISGYTLVVSALIIIILPILVKLNWESSGPDISAPSQDLGNTEQEEVVTTTSYEQVQQLVKTKEKDSQQEKERHEESEYAQLANTECLERKDELSNSRDSSKLTVLTSLPESENGPTMTTELKTTTEEYEPTTAGEKEKEQEQETYMSEIEVEAVRGEAQDNVGVISPTTLPDRSAEQEQMVLMPTQAEDADDVSNADDSEVESNSAETSLDSTKLPPGEGYSNIGSGHQEELESHKPAHSTDDSTMQPNVGEDKGNNEREQEAEDEREYQQEAELPEAEDVQQQKSEPNEGERAPEENDQKKASEKDEQQYQEDEEKNGRSLREENLHTQLTPNEEHDQKGDQVQEAVDEQKQQMEDEAEEQKESEEEDRDDLQKPDERNQQDRYKEEEIGEDENQLEDEEAYTGEEKEAEHHETERAEQQQYEEPNNVEDEGNNKEEEPQDKEDEQEKQRNFEDEENREENEEVDDEQAHQGEQEEQQNCEQVNDEGEEASQHLQNHEGTYDGEEEGEGQQRQEEASQQDNYAASPPSTEHTEQEEQGVEEQEQKEIEVTQEEKAQQLGDEMANVEHQMEGDQLRETHNQVMEAQNDETVEDQEADDFPSSIESTASAVDSSSPVEDTEDASTSS